MEMIRPDVWLAVMLNSVTRVNNLTYSAAVPLWEHVLWR